MSSEYLHTNLVYAVITRIGAPEGPQNALNSQAGFLKVWSDHLVLGEWEVPYDRMQDAELVACGLGQYRLKFTAAGLNYDFTSISLRFWRGELPFPVVRRPATLKEKVLAWMPPVWIMVGPLYLILSKSF